MSKTQEPLNKLAFIVLNYFGHNDTIKCIDSILTEFVATIFLIDNSIDLEERRVLKDKYDTNNKVKLFFPKKNIGFSSGVNLGINEAIALNFKYFFLLNNDALLAKGSGEELLNALDNNPSSLISLKVNWAGKSVGLKYYHPYLGLLSDKKESDSWIPYFTGCALVFSKELIEKVGFFDESFFMYGEDIDFSIRAKQNNFSFILLDKKNWIEHYGSKSTKVSSFFYEYHIVRGHFLLTKKLNNNFTTRSLIYILKGSSLFVRALIRSIRYTSLSPLLAYFASPIALEVRPK